MTDPRKRQIGGAHYLNLGIQPVEFAMANRWDFCAGAVLKYLTRWRVKNGVADLQKARHFIDLRLGHVLDWGVTLTRIPMSEYVMANQIKHAADARALELLEVWVQWPHYRIGGIDVRVHLTSLLDGMIAEAGAVPIATP